MSTTEEYITTVEAGKLMGVTRVYVWQLVSSGKIPGKRFGRQWMVLPSNIRTWLTRPVGKVKKA